MKVTSLSTKWLNLITVYKVVEPNVRPGVCSAIVGVLFHIVPALQYIDYWPSALDTLVIPYWDICTLGPIILYTHWFSIPFCRFCSRFFSPMSAPIYGGDVGATKNGSGDERSDDLLGRPAPPPQNQCFKKLKNFETRFATYPLIGTIAARALPPRTVNGRKARRTLSWDRRHGHWLEPIQDLKPNGHCGRRWYTESTKC